MRNPIRKVVIAGGGVAGWLCAAILSKVRQDHHVPLEITLIEPSTLHPIGVGEATTTTTVQMLKWLGIDEHDWMKQCDATFKFGLCLANWRQVGEFYWHVFENPRVVDGITLPLVWLAQNPHRDFQKFSSDSFVAPYLCRTMKSPKRLGGHNYESILSYGYHVSVDKYVAYLKRMTLSQVLLIDDIVEHAVKDADGYIDHLVTQNHQHISGDLFVDCTGFMSLLAQKALNEPFVSFGDNLLCDRAIALRLPHREADQAIRPYTTATALDAGWVWDIPLQSRDGVGYVFSGAHASDDEALQHFSRHLGRDVSLLDPQFLRFRSGMNERSVINNCISIGLANGFIEPLESTGNSLTELVVTHLYDLLANHANEVIPSADIDRMNQNIHNSYLEVRDFIILHYCLTGRSDTTFWLANQNQKLPESVVRKIEFVRSGLPEINMATQELPWHDFIFPQYSYLCVFIGMNQCPHISIAPNQMKADQEADMLFDNFGKKAAQLANDMPTHREFLESLKTISS